MSKRQVFRVAIEPLCRDAEQFRCFCDRQQTVRGLRLGTLGRHVGERAQLVEDRPIHYTRMDLSGNVVGLFQDTTQDFWFQYDAWGNSPVGYIVDYSPYVCTSQCAVAAPGWKGALYLHATALYYMRNRWYDPATGRFMSEDPIGLNGGISLYAYAGDEPVNGFDPFGLCHHGDGVWDDPVPPGQMKGVCVYGQKKNGPYRTATDAEVMAAQCVNWDDLNECEATLRTEQGEWEFPVDPTPPDVGEQAWRECKAAMVRSVLTGLGDLLFLSGLGTVQRLESASLSALRATVRYDERLMSLSADAAYADATAWSQQAAQAAAHTLEHHAGVLGLESVLEHSSNPLSYFPVTDLAAALTHEWHACFNPE